MRPRAPHRRSLIFLVSIRSVAKTHKLESLGWDCQILCPRSHAVVAMSWSNASDGFIQFYPLRLCTRCGLILLLGDRCQIRAKNQDKDITGTSVAFADSFGAVRPRS